MSSHRLTLSIPTATFNLNNEFLATAGLEPTPLVPSQTWDGSGCATNWTIADIFKNWNYLCLLFSLNNYSTLQEHILYICDFNNVSNNCSSTLLFSILKMNLQYTLYKVASFIMWFRGLVSVRCASAKRIWNHALNPINQTILPHYWSHLTNWLFDINLFFSFFNFMFSKKAT